MSLDVLANPATPYDIFIGDGEMSRLMRAHDWERDPSPVFSECP